VAAARRLALLHGLPIIPPHPSAPFLAEALLHSGLLPRSAADDAVHIALAALRGSQFLLTWNFRHIANPNQVQKMGDLIASHGHRCPLNCTPEKLSAPSP
jgi:hypothetical protein